MKRLISALMLIVAVFSSHKDLRSQSPNFLWVEQGGSSNNNDWCRSIATGRFGNCIAVGRHIAPATFGSFTLTDLAKDMFIVKYDGNGRALWARNAGGFGIDEAYDVTTDASGNIIVTGKFWEQAGFEGVTLDGGRGSGWNVFLVKYNESGQALWAQQAVGRGTDEGDAVAIDKAGNVIIAGAFEDTVRFNQTALVSAGLSDIFIAKYDTSGQLLWLQQVGGASVETGGDVATDSAGNILVAGTFRKTITIGDTTLAAIDNVDDVFIAKYDTHGRLLWARRDGGANLDRAKGIAVDGSGSALLTGAFAAMAIFGNDTLRSASPNFDLFVAKYDPAGKVRWAERAGGNLNDEGASIALDPHGNSVIAGFFRARPLSAASRATTSDPTKARMTCSLLNWRAA